ncbi:MAG: hypothetical protein FJ056_10840 [Cyanobacteria bacterium M_surface_10_m2_179]|nr:hypothetical protein [Cyanobacteria bacterium M_surface_10_m2_179]
MSCGYCGERLISKTSEGLTCCGCGMPLDQTRPQARQSFSATTLMVFSLWVMAALPFVGAIAATDELRFSVLAPEVAEPQERRSPE